VHANYAALSDGALFRNPDIMQGIFDDNTTVDSFNHKLVVGARCSADYNRPCSTNMDCLNLEECLTRVPDVGGAVDGGAASSPVGVQSLGFSLISIMYDSAESAWKARVRYDHTIPGVIHVLYLPHITTRVSAIERATFRPDEFPCPPVGEGEFQKRRQDSVCCLSVFEQDYTTVDNFDENVSDPLNKLLQTINAQSACVGDACPPTNMTKVMLDTSLDFVEEGFSRMPRSHASRDPTQTRGYRDILLYLAEEDMRAVGGIESNLKGGYSLRFFVGMAHIKPIESNHLHASFSQAEVTADVTQAYVFTSSSLTDYTFIRDISVSLVQITDKTGGTPLKFARVQLTVPPNVNTDEATGIIPADSARVSAGYSLDSSRPVFYPCVVSLYVHLFMIPCLTPPPSLLHANTQSLSLLLTLQLVHIQDVYSGASRTTINQLLTRQSWCALSDTLCGAIGPKQVSDGGQIHYIFPLTPDVWDDADLDANNFFRKYLFMDFLVNVVGSDGKRALTRVQTRTEIKKLSVNRQCDETQVSSSVSDIVQVDMFLGLTGNASSFDKDLIQASDITCHPERSFMRREVSSIGANVLTMLVKGDSSAFQPGFAQEYALEVEDMFSMHFLKIEKKLIVDAMIAQNLAFSMQTVPGESSGWVRLIPSKMLLAICPIHATENEFGCITRREIQERLYDTVTYSIVDISPSEFEADDAPYNRSSIWLQKLLGSSAFVKNLGYNHAKVMAEKYSLNNRYCKGFMISPTVPWRRVDMDREMILSNIDLAQFSTSVVLVALNQNEGETYVPTIQVAIPGISLPLRVSDFTAANIQILQGVVAGVTGTSPDSVTLGEVTPSETQSSRRLLENKDEEWVKFTLQEGFRISDEQSARQRADAFVRALREDESPLMHDIMNGLQQSGIGSERMMSLETLPAQDLNAVYSSDVPTCKNKPAFELDVTPLVRSMPSWDTTSRAMVTCSRRFVYNSAGNAALQYESFKTPVSVRGPQIREDWALYHEVNEELGKGGRSYSFAIDKNGQDMHWMWWDFCADMPQTGNVDAVLWRKMRDEFTSSCCLCQPNTPAFPETRVSYTHKYSWPIMLGPTFDMKRMDLAETWVVNLQINNFRTVPHSSSFSPKNTPPKQWTVRANGDTQIMQCEPGFFLEEFDKCSACVAGTFQDQAGKQTCKPCPSMTTSPSQATATRQCQCIPGYTLQGLVCVECAEKFFKATSGNEVCTACPSASTSRLGAEHASLCHAPLGAEQYVDYLFDLSVGMLIEQDMEQGHSNSVRRCALSDSAASLSCSRQSYPSIFAARPMTSSLSVMSSQSVANLIVTPALQGSATSVAVMGIQEHKLAVLTLFLRKSYMGPAPMGFSQKLLRKVWTDGMRLRLAPRFEMLGANLASSNAGDSELRMVVVVSSRELDPSLSSRDSEWVVCGHKSGSGFGYGICKSGMDPDNVHAQNIMNPLILDAEIFDLHGTDCCSGHGTDGTDVFDREIVWTQKLQSSGGTHPDAWIYIFFTSGDSTACLMHNCNEALVYADIGAHLRDYRFSTNNPRMMFLPGTQFSYVMATGIAEDVVLKPLQRSTLAPSPLVVQGHDSYPAGTQQAAPQAAGLPSARRFLLTTAQTQPSSSNLTSYSRTITSIDNNEQIAKSQCQGKAHECSMLNLDIVIPGSDYCMPESQLIAQYTEILQNRLKAPMKFFRVVSIIRKDYISVCQNADVAVGG